MTDWRRTECEKCMIQWMLDNGIGMEDAIDVMEYLNDTNSTLADALKLFLYGGYEEDSDDESEEPDETYWKNLRNIICEQIKEIDKIIDRKNDRDKS